MEAGDAQHLLHMNYEFLAEIDVKISIALATNLLVSTGLYARLMPFAWLYITYWPNLLLLYLL